MDATSHAFDFDADFPPTLPPPTQEMFSALQADFRALQRAFGASQEALRFSSLPPTTPISATSLPPQPPVDSPPHPTPISVTYSLPDPRLVAIHQTRLTSTNLSDIHRFYITLHTFSTHGGVFEFYHLVELRIIPSLIDLINSILPSPITSLSELTPMQFLDALRNLRPTETKTFQEIFGALQVSPKTQITVDHGSQFLDQFASLLVAHPSIGLISDSDVIHLLLARLRPDTLRTYVTEALMLVPKTLANLKTTIRAESAKLFAAQAHSRTHPLPPTTSLALIGSVPSKRSSRKPYGSRTAVPLADTDIIKYCRLCFYRTQARDGDGLGCNYSNHTPANCNTKDTLANLRAKAALTLPPAALLASSSPSATAIVTAFLNELATTDPTTA